MPPSSPPPSDDGAATAAAPAGRWSAATLARGSDEAARDASPHADAGSSHAGRERRGAAFLRVAARFYLLSRPFWLAAEHAPGFSYYPDAAPVEAAAPDAGASSHAGSAVAPPFKHSQLQSPALIPRAVGRRASSDAAATPASTPRAGALFASPSSSPFLAPAASPPPPAGLDSVPESAAAPLLGARLCPSWRSLWGFSDAVYRWVHLSPRRIAWSWSVLMVVLLLVCTYLHVLMSFCHRHMSTALAARDADAFYAALSMYFGSIVLASPLLSISQYAKSQLALHWRIYLTNRLLQSYFRKRNYYYMQPGNMAGAGAGAAAAAVDAQAAVQAAQALKSSLASDASQGRSKSRRAGGKAGSGASLSSAGLIDNPDQRICDDIRAFTRSSLTFANELLDELFQVLAFAGILWAISPALVAGLLLYAGLGTYLATSVFGLRLIRVNSKQSKLEADFRFSLVRVRTNAEAIAFYSGERAELSYLYWRFAKIVRNLAEMAGVQCQLSLFKHAYGFATLLIPPLLLAPLYFRGEVELGVISQASMAFRQVFNSLNLVVGKMNELSKWRSGMERIWQMEQSLERQERWQQRQARQRRDSISIERQSKQAGAATPADESAVWWSAEAPAPGALRYASIQVRPSAHLRLEHLMVCVQGDPSDQAAQGQEQSGAQGARRGERVLVQNLSLFLPTMQRPLADATESPLAAALAVAGVVPRSGPRGLLIMGRSGIGKSTLLRAIAGLWKNGSGTIHRPDLSSLLFLPQRAYMVAGTLRQQLLYPYCPQPRATGRKAATAASSSEPDAQELDAAESSASSFGLRRRWPVQSSAAPASPSSARPSASPSPPPPSSSAALGAACDTSLGGMPSDADLEHILRLVNLAHLTAASGYSARAAEQGPQTPRDAATADSQPAAASAPAAPAVGLDVLCDWSEVLSLGESQRVAFARVLIHQPSFVFCDESTAALDAHNEEALYAALSTHAPCTSLVSVGHRPALLRHHSHVLHLQEAGRWQLLEINERNREDIDRITALTVTT